jgi:transposase
MPQERSRVELYAALRRDSHAGMSNRALQRKYGVTWSTVDKALNSAWPQPRTPYAPRASKLDPFKPVVDEILLIDLDAPKKQRHTATRIYHRLLDEHSMNNVSYQVVRGYVAKRRPEIRIEAGRGPAQVFVPQSHLPGAEAEVDFGEVVVQLRGEPVKCMLFCLRLSYSGKAVHRVFASGGQEAFFEGHAHAFRVLGGVPFGKVRYDNLKAAVAKVLGFARARVETERWTAFRSHYGIEAFYCQPGIEGAHEKGGVEGRIGWFRRNRLVPVPEVDSLAELNEQIDRWDIDDEDRRIGSRPRTVGELFAAEQPLLKPPPFEVFETGRWFNPRVDRFSQITVRTNHYSVPTRLIGRQVRVLLNASDLIVFDGRTEVAHHERLLAKGGSRLELDHYLEALVRKPGALPGATALEQARAAGKFTPIHETWWQAACQAHGDAAGTRDLIEVLLLHRHMNHEHIVAGLAGALQVGALTADAVALEARLVADRDDATAAVSPKLSSNELARPPRPLPRITSLTKRRLAQLPPDTRPLPSLEAYDLLLPSRRAAAEAAARAAETAVGSTASDRRAPTRKPRKKMP